MHCPVHDGDSRHLQHSNHLEPKPSVENEKCPIISNYMYSTYEWGNICTSEKFSFFSFKQVAFHLTIKKLVIQEEDPPDPIQDRMSMRG